MLILLPPSEGKAQAGGDLAFAECHPELLAETKAVLKHVNSLSADARMKFFALKTKEKATACHALNQSALKAPVLPAVERYTGVVYQHLDYRTLKKKRAAEKRIFVVSGLFGVTGGGTKIPPYKMPINPWLIRYWKEINTNFNLVQKSLSDFPSVLPLISSCLKQFPPTPKHHIPKIIDFSL